MRETTKCAEIKTAQVTHKNILVFESLFIVFLQGLPGPSGDIGPEGIQGRQVSPLSRTLTYLYEHICSDLDISCQDWFQQEFGELQPLFVCNRPRVNFWLQATVTPIITGYTSTRMKHAGEISLKALYSVFKCKIQLTACQPLQVTIVGNYVKFFPRVRITSLKHLF